MALTDKLIAIADGFRTSRGLTEELSLDRMAELASEEIGGSGSSALTFISKATGQIIIPSKGFANTSVDMSFFGNITARAVGSLTDG